MIKRIFGFLNLNGWQLSSEKFDVWHLERFLQFYTSTKFDNYHLNYNDLYVEYFTIRY